MNKRPQASFPRVARRLLRAALILGSVAASVLLAGYLFERIARARTASTFPPPGNLVDAGDKEIHINCTGSGEPTIVIEAGSGSWSLDWKRAQGVLDRHYHVCSYDRAGYGWSAGPSAGRDGKSINRDLRLALDAAGIDRPVVLMGHSLGGLYARRYALEHPREVAGLILVDSRHEDAAKKLPDGILAQEEQTKRTYRVARVAARLGLVRLLAPHLLPDPGLPGEDRQTFWAQASVPSFYDTVSAEVRALPATARDVAGRRLAVPLVVVRHGDEQMFGGHPDSAAASRAWREMQESLLELSDQSSLIVAGESGHNVHLEQPEILLEAAEELERLLGSSGGQGEAMCEACDPSGSLP